MTVRIVHASIDERGRISGGNVGDQTSKEVCIRKWYKKPWDYCIRFNDSNLARKAVNNAIYLANSNLVGYDQTNRNSLNTALKKVGYNISKLNVLCETDCSAFLSVVCQTVGINIPYSGNNAPTTRTMVNAFKSTGAFTILNDSRYLYMDSYLRKGDILVKEGSHTVMAIDNGDKSGVSDNINNANTLPYKIGETYTLVSNLFVRCSPAGEKKFLSLLSANAKKNAYDDGHGYGILKKGTRVTCQGITIVGNQTWIKIPSGYVCGIDGTKIYIK